MEQGEAEGGKDAMWGDGLREAITEAPGHHSHLASGVRLTLLRVLLSPWPYNQVGYPETQLKPGSSACRLFFQ